MTPNVRRKMTQLLKYLTETGDCCTMAMQTFVHDPHTTNRTEEKSSNNSKAFSSEFLENLKEMFSSYYMHSDMSHV